MMPLIESPPGSVRERSVDLVAIATPGEARRSADPSRTGKLRRGFRAEAALKLRMLRSGLRKALIEFNVLGLNGGPTYGLMSSAARLDMFAGWVENAAYAALDARWWVHPWIDKATQHGLMTAQQERRGDAYQPHPTTFESLHQLARHEIRGIIAALVQKTVRQAHSAAARKLVPHQAFREMAPILDKDIHNRLQAFAHVMTVKAHVAGKIAHYRNAGVTHVGVIPELRSPRRIHRHAATKSDAARFRDQEEPADVTWQTADDDLVCDECEEMAAGSPYSLDEIADLIPLHVNCRCAPVVWEGLTDSYVHGPTRLDAGNPDVDFTQGEGGRFTGSIGHGHTQSPSHHHEHYSEETKVRGGTVFTSNVYDATRALYEGRKVQLKQPKQVSTLVVHLGAVSTRMAELGRHAPNFDLCRVTVKGTNLFCAESKGIPRIEMPQLNKAQTKAFVTHLAKNYSVDKGHEKASHLRATQNELSGVKVAANVKKMKDDPAFRERRIVISRDDYILDGHHKWAALLAIDAKNNKLGDIKMRVARIDVDIITLLRLANQFTGGKGRKGVHDTVFDEVEYTQGEGGRFTGSIGHGHGIAEKKKYKAEDFLKAKISLQFHGKEQTDRFVEQWDDKVGESPEDFRKEFLGGVDSDMNIGAPYGSWQISGNILEGGTRVGSYNREIDWNRKTAESAFLALNRNTTGKNIGKRILAGNIATYRKLGIEKVLVHANIDVGGYAWAKYGYVPTLSSWASLQRDIQSRLGVRGDTPHRSSSPNSYEPSSWEEIADADQERIREAWARETFSEFIESEVQNWRESGEDLHAAKKQLADNFDGTNTWATEAVAQWRKEHPDTPYGYQQIIASVSVTYDDQDFDGQADPKIEFDDAKLREPSDAPPKEQMLLPGFKQIDLATHLTQDDRDEIRAALIGAFNTKAERDRDDVEAPDYLRENVGEYQDDYWSSMSERDRYRWASRHNELPQYDIEHEEIVESKQKEMPLPDDLKQLAQSSNPKALWAIADHPRGKELLLNTDWSGVLNLNDKESMDRFNAYVGKVKKAA